MELVTGHGGADHISAADLASMYRGLLVSENVVLASGDKLSCTMVDANTAEIGVGDCMVQAHHCRVETAEQIAIENGSPGYKRNDLIVIRYTLGDGNIQDVYLDVIKGTAVTGTPSDPTYTDGDIDGGDTLVEFPLWRIPIDGVNVGTPVRVMPTVDTLQEQITANAGAITSLRESVSLTSANITYASGYTYYSGTGYYLFKTNNIVVFTGSVARTGESAFNAQYPTIGTLPAGFRPTHQTAAPCQLIGSGWSIPSPTTGAVRVETDGTVRIYLPSSYSSAIAAIWTIVFLIV